MECDVCQSPKSHVYMVGNGIISTLCRTCSTGLDAIPLKPHSQSCPECRQFGKCCNTKGGE